MVEIKKMRAVWHAFSLVVVRLLFGNSPNNDRTTTEQVSNNGITRKLTGSSVNAVFSGGSGD